MPLAAWLPEATLQAIAAENNLSETAFFVPQGDGFHLRWFTPKCEVRLCGHATLAAAFVLFTELEPGRAAVRFDTLSGPLFVRQVDGRLEMDFPAIPVQALPAPPPGLAEALGLAPQEWHFSAVDRNHYAVYVNEAEVRALRPDFARLAPLVTHGIVATAPGDRADCASRYFAPGYGIDEDPVTGSIHAALVPFWAYRLGKPHILAHQVSARGGVLFCEDRGERVAIAGHAVKYLVGSIFI
jgi:PhzF family phenazine biosynthesis protein